VYDFARLQRVVEGDMPRTYVDEVEVVREEGHDDWEINEFT